MELQGNFNVSENWSLYNENCIDFMDWMIEHNQTVDFTLTSPPYDKLRSYDKTCTWNFEVFKQVADRLYKVTREGGVVVWVVGDSFEDGSMTLTSFRQALYFKEVGFNFYDDILFEKNSVAHPAKPESKRYTQIYEHMFILSKGEIRDDITLLRDKANKYAGYSSWGKCNSYDKDGNLIEGKKIKVVPDFSIRNNIWRYTTGHNPDNKRFGKHHPAVFPEKLAADHIKSWSVEGDLVFDPFSGSATTGKMAILNNRRYLGCELNTEYFNDSIDRMVFYTNEILKKQEAEKQEA